MALTCQMAISPSSYRAGQSPSPMALLTVYNPNAVAVVVTGVVLVFKDAQGSPRQFSVSPSVVPVGYGQTTSVPALSSITIGPFPIAVGNVAPAAIFNAVPPSSQPSLVQVAMPPQSKIFIEALVYGSDGSVNVSGAAGLLVTYTDAPPVAFQGGFANFYDPNAAAFVAAGVG
jgi:uncharacterized membrane protein